MSRQRLSLHSLLLFAAFLHQPMAHAQVARADFLSEFPTILATNLCKASAYFRTCFDVSAEECENMVTSAAISCVKRYASDIPKQLGAAEEEHHGGVLGGCAGETYATEFLARRLNDKACNVPSNWIGTEPTWIGQTPISGSCRAG